MKRTTRYIFWDSLLEFMFNIIKEEIILDLKQQHVKLYLFYKAKLKTIFFGKCKEIRKGDKLDRNGKKSPLNILFIWVWYTSLPAYLKIVQIIIQINLMKVYIIKIGGLKSLLASTYLATDEDLFLYYSRLFSEVGT